MSDLASVTDLAPSEADLAPSEADVPTAEDIKSLYEHVLSLWPLAASAPGVVEASLEGRWLTLSGGSRATARPLGQEHLTSVLQCCSDSQSESLSNLYNAFEVLGAYTQIPSHSQDVHSAFGIALPRQYPQSGVNDVWLKFPQPHTLSLKHQSADAEPQCPTSVSYLDVDWAGQEGNDWGVKFHVKTLNRETSSASRAMLGHPSTDTEWTVYIQLSPNEHSSSFGAE